MGRWATTKDSLSRAIEEAVGSLPQLIPLYKQRQQALESQ